MTTMAHRQSGVVYYWSYWTFAPLAVACTALAAPFVLTHHAPGMWLVLQRAFALVCHQRPERCFWIFGAPVAVCSRCLGIYLGAALGLLGRTSRRIAVRLLIATAAANGVDAITEVAGLHGNWMWLRFVLGMALGAAGALLIASSIPRPSSAASNSCQLPVVSCQQVSWLGSNRRL